MAEQLSASNVAEAKWGPLALATLITCWSLWYLIDAYSASSRLQNLIFIAPLVGIISLLFVVELVTTLFRSARDVREEDAVVAAATAKPVLMPLAVMIMLALYTLTLPSVGFDLGTYIFIVGCLLAQGERRPLVVFVFPAAFALAVVWVFKSMLSLPMPTWIV